MLNLSGTQCGEFKLMSEGRRMGVGAYVDMKHKSTAEAVNENTGDQVSNQELNSVNSTPFTCWID